MTSRRHFLYGLLCTPVVLRHRLEAAGISTTYNPVQIENQKTGTAAWQIGLPGYAVQPNDSLLYIRGYASATSINKGEKITLFITVNSYDFEPTVTDSSYSIDVYRVGWYGGKGGRLMKHIGGLNGISQPAPVYDSATGMIACQWTGDGAGTGSYTLDTSVNPDGSTTADWTSGVYLALLTRHHPTWSGSLWQSYIIFTIREDARTSDVLFQQAVATYQAYNNYPDDQQTGKSLYDSGSYGALTDLGTQRAVKVSFDRPYTYTDHTGAGDFLHWELYFIRWMERNGYDVTYSTDIDTHVNGSALLNHKLFLSVGHAEYWSTDMRLAVESARDKGVGVAFFGANALYTQIRLEPSPASGQPDRVITCYKDATLDPVNNPASVSYNPPLTTVPFRNAPVNWPEQPLVGVMYDDYIDAEAPPLALVVQDTSHWIFASTGLTNGTKIPGILGYEMDAQFPASALPAAIAGSYQLLSSSPFAGTNGSGISNSSIYQAVNGPGAWVFGAGTIDWSFGLDSYTPPAGVNTRGFPAPNVALQQITANFLNRTTGRLANPTGLKASEPSNGRFRITLNWTNNAPSQTGVIIERSTDGFSFGQLATVSATTSSYTDTTADPTVAYYYRVAAFTSAGTSAYSNTVAIGPPPAAPSQLMAVAVSGSEIDLTWTDNSTNENAFLVESSTDNKNFSQIASLPAGSTSYQNTGLVPGVTYYYRVRAQNQFGTSGYSNTAAATTLGPPAAPSKLTASAASASQINLSWQNNSSNETGFYMMRSTDGVNFVLIATITPSTVNTYADSGLTANSKYYYQISSFNQYGTSAPSNTASATTRKK